jgi:hypothetical protein
MSRFTKISDAGVVVPKDAASWIAVHDALTNLVWAKSHLPKAYTFEGAKKAAAKFSGCGKDQWRAPTAWERMSIVDFSRHAPALDIDYFDASQTSGWEWTATEDASSPRGSAWFVYLCSGGCSWYSQSFHSHVRPVLAGQLLGLSASVEGS